MLQYFIEIPHRHIRMLKKCGRKRGNTTRVYLYAHKAWAEMKKGGSKMQGQTVRIVSQAIRYIEEHLHEKMDLDMVASALHYSKYHLHRIFPNTVGLTIHDYAGIYGHFKAMYKASPAEFREMENFNPLQPEIYLKEELVKMGLAKDNIKFAMPEGEDPLRGYLYAIRQ